MDSVVGTTEAAIVIGRLDVAFWAVGVVESVTVIATDAVPTELCAGVPVIAPVELLIDKPLGKPLALYL
jgi:hypothetical protein